MEEKHECFRFRFYQKLVISLIFFYSGTINRMQVIASSDELEKGRSSEFRPRTYIVESYVDKYTLQDSDFEDFLAHELPSGSCNLLLDNAKLAPRLLALQRTLIGEGSHRRLSSSIKLQVNQESEKSQPPTHFCKLIVIERLPSGVFADPFELQHLHQRGVFTDVAVFGDTNLEAPSFLSNRSIVEVHKNIGSNVLSAEKDGLEIDIQLPLHARYQPLDESGYTAVEFGEPDLFLSCGTEHELDISVCLFRLPTDVTKSRAAAVSWRIPSGIPAHSGVVSVLTFIAASLSTFLIVWSSVFHSGIKAKQS